MAVILITLVAVIPIFDAIIGELTLESAITETLVQAIVLILIVTFLYVAVKKFNNTLESQGGGTF